MVCVIILVTSAITLTHCRGFGFVPSYEQLISDSLEFIRNQLCNLHNTLPVYIVGHRYENY